MRSNVDQKPRSVQEKEDARVHVASILYLERRVSEGIERRERLKVKANCQAL